MDADDDHIEDAAWVSMRDAAEAMGCSVDTVRRRIKRGDLPARKETTPQGWRWLVQVPQTATQKALESPESAVIPASDPAPMIAEIAALRADIAALRAELARVQAELPARVVAALPAEAEPPSQRKGWRAWLAWLWGGYTKPPAP